MEGMNLKPREIVEQLDRYIIGQNQAKRAVAVALRNRWRRRQLDPEMQQEVTPKNILMMGPTGVGKTEIARRLAKLVNAPFVKVEATKYTEVGYVARDVESMVRDLVEASIRMVKEAHMDSVREQAQGRANERLVQALVPVGKKEHRTENPLESLQRLMGVQQEEPELPPEEREKVATRRDAVRKQLLAGRLEDIEITIEVEDAGLTMELPGSPGGVNIQDMMGGLMQKMKKRTMPVKEARRILEEDEAQKLIDMDAVQEEALRKAEQEGILFIDEIDKVAGRSSGQGPDVSPGGGPAGYPAHRGGLHRGHQIRFHPHGLYPLHRRRRLPCQPRGGSDPRAPGPLPHPGRAAAPNQGGFLSNPHQARQRGHQAVPSPAVGG